MSESIQAFEIGETIAPADDAHLWRYRTFLTQYRSLWRASYRVAYRLLGDREQAAAVAQEACLRACTRWRKLGASGHARGWTVLTSANLALDRVPSPGDPGESLLGGRIDLARAVAALPKRRREVVILRFLADIPELEAASVIGCSVAKLSARTAAGFTELQHVLAHGAA